MDKLIAVLKREYLERVRTKWFLIATLFGPLFFGAMLYLPSLLTARESAKGPESYSNIVVIDAANADLGERIVNALGGGLLGSGSPARLLKISPEELESTEEKAAALVVSDSVNGYMVVDSNTVSGKSVRYIGSNTTAMLQMSSLERVVQRQVQLLHMESAGLDAETSARLASVNISLETEKLTKHGRSDRNPMSGFMFGLGIAMLLYMTIFIYGINVMRGVLEEKQSRVAEVVIASISPTKLLVGKVVGTGAVGLTQIFIWTCTGFLMYKLRAKMPGSLETGGLPFTVPDMGIGAMIVILLLFISGFLFYAGLFAAAGATVNSDQEAQQAQMPIVILLIVSMMFLQNIIMQPDGTMSTVLSLLPFSAPIVMPMRMTITHVSTIQMIVSVLSVSIAAVIATWLAARIYRVGLLMYGKRPGISEVVRWIRTT